MTWHLGFHLDEDGRITGWWVELRDRGEPRGTVVSGNRDALVNVGGLEVALADIAWSEYPPPGVLFLASLPAAGEPDELK